jgi:peptidoglycan/LPS O-acetylase OafA/YrhL
MSNSEANTYINAAKSKKHFETFDALRFFAFLKVFLLHIPIVAFPWFNFIRAGGGIGVQFFFVLSGFLITYIICEEKQQTGSLNLKNFFVRRILRIWPLYYLMVFIAYLTPYILKHFLHLNSSSEGYEPNFLMSALFLENYKMMATHQHANVSPLSVMWSLCIEEHFYIVWGLLLYFIKIKSLPKMIAVCILLSITCRIFFEKYNIPTIDIFSNIDLFALGAIPAYLLIIRENQTHTILAAVPFWTKLFFVFLLVIAVLIYSQLENDRFFIIGTTVLGILFSALILFVLPGKNQLRIRDNSLLSKMGIYTYGLYLYHTLVINFLIQIFRKENWVIENAGSALLFFTISFILTLVCSIISYNLYEKRFLKLKKYFR